MRATRFEMSLRFRCLTLVKAVFVHLGEARAKRVLGRPTQARPTTHMDLWSMRREPASCSDSLQESKARESSSYSGNRTTHGMNGTQSK